MAKDKGHPLDEIWDLQPDPAIEAQRNDAIARSSGESPDRTGRLFDIAIQSGLSIEALSEASDLDLEALGHRSELHRRNRVVNEFRARHPRHALITHDDIDSLGRMQLAASRLRDQMGEIRLNQASIGIEKGLGGIGAAFYGLLQFAGESQQALNELVGFHVPVITSPLVDPESLSLYAAERAEIAGNLPAHLLAQARGIPLDRAQQVVATYEQTKGQIFGIGLDDVIATGVSLAPTLVAAPLGLGGIALTAGSQSAGGTFAEKRAEGLDLGESAGLALLSGAITASLTRAMPGGTERVAQLVRKAGDPAAVLRSHLVVAMGKEAFGEFLEEGLDETLQALLVDGSSMQEALQRGLKGGILGGIFGGGFGVAPGLYAARRQRALAALDFNERLEVMDAAVEASATKGRSQELAATFLQSHAGLNQAAYIDGAIVAGLSQDPGVAAQLERAGVDQASVRRAVESGGTVEVPLARFFTHLEPDLKAVLKPLLRSYPNAPSATEAQAFDAEAEARQAQDEETEDAARFRAEYVAEVQRLAQETSQAQAVPMEDAQAQVLPLTRAAWSFYERNPGAYDSPMDLLQRVSIRRGTAEEGQAAVEAVASEAEETAPVEGQELLQTTQERMQEGGFVTAAEAAERQQAPPSDPQAETRRIERIVGVAELGEVTGEIAADFERRREFYQSAQEPDAGDGARAYEPWPGLDADQRAVEAELARILSGPDAEERYAALAESIGGKVLNVDLARELSPAYAAGPQGRFRYTLATQRPASAFIDRLFQQRLAGEPQGPVLFLAGGGGSGKSTVSEGPDAPLAQAIQAAEIVLDGTLASTDKALRRVAAVLVSGRSARVAYVHRPLESAATGVGQRSQRTGRIVPPHVLVSDHVGAQETVLALAQRYADADEFALQIWDNSGTEPSEMAIADLATRRYTQGGEGVESAVQRLLPAIQEPLDGDYEATAQALGSDPRAGQGLVRFGEGADRRGDRPPAPDPDAGAEAPDAGTDGEAGRGDGAGRQDPEEDGLELQQGDEPSARGSVLIHDTGYLILLFQKADLSTILHETGHVFLEEMRSLVRGGRASEQTVRDWQTLQQWLGAEGIDQPITREQHERFAQGFETYLATAEAPSIELEPAFARFRRWLSRIYAAARGALVDLPSEVRSVFDRMLAADDEIRQVALANEWTSRSAAELDRIPGVAEGRRSRFNQLMQDGRQRMADALWKERTRRAAERRSVWREGIDAEMAQMPVYQAWDTVRAGGGLRHAHILLEFGQDTVNALREKGLIATRTETGIITDAVALEHGFEDGEAAVLALLEALPPKRYRQERLAQLEAESDAESSAMEAVLEAPEFLEAMEALGTYLTTAIRGTDSQLSRQKIRRQAERQFADTPLREATRVDRYLAALQQATRAERKAVTKDDFAAAVEHNHTARLNFELAKLARDARRKRDAAIKRVRKAARAKLGTIDAQHHKNLVLVALRYGLIDQPTIDLRERDALADIVAGVDAEFDMRGAFSRDILDETRQQDWRTLTVSEFEELAHLMSFLEKRGRMLRSETIAGGKARIADVVAESIDLMGNLKDKTPWFDSDTTMGKAVDGLKSGIIGNITQMDYVFRAADNFNGARVKDLDPNRALTKHVVLATSAAERDAQRRLAEFGRLIEPHQDVLTRAMDRIGTHPTGDLPPLPKHYRSRVGRSGWTNRMLLAAAFNLGNSYNADATARGLGLVTLDENGDEVGDVDRLHRSLAGQFTVEQWQAIQGTWDAINTLWPESAAVHERLFGFRPPKVDAEPLTVLTADGQTITLPGGHFPLRFDNRLSQRQGAQDERTDAMDIFGAAFAPTAAKRGHLKARTNSGGKPVLLDVGQVLREHVDFSVRFITHAEVVRDANRIFTDPTWAETFTDKFGRHIHRRLNGWLRAQVVREHEDMNWFDNAIEYLRPKTALYVLGFRPASAITQLDALASLPADIGVRNYLRGLSFTADPPEMVRQWQNMMKLSPFMRERLYGGRDREMHDLLRGFDLDKAASTLGKAVKAGHHVALSPIIYSSLGIEGIGWIAMFHATLPKVNGDVDQAALLADEMIASSQPATRIKDFSALQRSRKGVARIFTLLMTFPFRRGNANVFAWKAILNGKMSLADGLTYSFLTWFIAPTLALLVKHLIWGDDDEERQKELLKDAAHELVLYQIQGIPLARDGSYMLRQLAETGSIRSRGLRTSLDTPYWIHKEGLEGAASLVWALGSDDDADVDAALWALADLTSFHLGIPITRAYEDLKEGLRQVDEEGAGPLNVLVPDPELRWR